MESPSGGSVTQRSGATVVKVEADLAALTPSQTAELDFLHLRIRQLEREKEEIVAENQRLKEMLVHEIPGLLSTMWQTLGQDQNHSISTTADRADNFIPYLHHHQHNTVTNPDVHFSPPAHLHPLGQEELSADMSEFCVPLGSEEEEEESRGGGGAELGLGTDMGEEAPLCSQTNMEELRKSCSQSLCAAATHHVSQVEVYPGSGVLCDLRSWHTANQAQSPTAMARTLLLGIFDMETLMNSNLRGGRSRRPAFHPQCNALDPQKINAIFNAILARFPLARRGIIGTGINSKLSEIRFRSRKANREPQFL
ncbi:uncharacterized protein LOC142988152 [Genypterus blacodes]|uniref:uncharacterized protein LOC142988152 n=1 Tax=Genypterus blacodes TaxID=154954 RepID=UPI003F775D9C